MGFCRTLSQPAFGRFLGRPDANANADTDADTDTYASADANTDADTDTDTDADAYANTDANTDSDTGAGKLSERFTECCTTARAELCGHGYVHIACR